MTCEWVCPDCRGRCGVDFATAEDIELALQDGEVFDHMDCHQPCEREPEE